MLTTAYLGELRRRVREEADFVVVKRLGYSLRRVLNRYPDGCPDKVIAAALLLTEEELAVIYDDIVQRLREKLKITAL